jgi:hypothetical protein
MMTMRTTDKPFNRCVCLMGAERRENVTFGSANGRW